MRNISKTVLLMLLLSKISLSFAATKSYPAPVPVTGEISTTAGSASGAAWPEKRFVLGRGATESCVTDKLTGLMWARNGNLFGRKSWDGASSAVSSMNNNKGSTAYKLCGYSDWRLPTKTELKSLVNYGKETPSEWLNDPVQGFNNVQDEPYWSSSTSTDFVWYVDFYNGSVSIFEIGVGKPGSYYVWPVRGGK